MCCYAKGKGKPYQLRGASLLSDIFAGALHAPKMLVPLFKRWLLIGPRLKALKWCPERDSNPQRPAPQAGVYAIPPPGHMERTAGVEPAYNRFAVCPITVLVHAHFGKTLLIAAESILRILQKSVDSFSFSSFKNLLSAVLTLKKCYIGNVVEPPIFSERHFVHMFWHFTATLMTNFVGIHW